MVHIFFIVVSLVGGPSNLYRSDEVYPSVAVCMKAQQARVTEANKVLQRALKKVVSASCMTDDMMKRLETEQNI